MFAPIQEQRILDILLADPRGRIPCALRDVHHFLEVGGDKDANATSSAGRLHDPHVAGATYLELWTGLAPGIEGLSDLGEKSFTSEIHFFLFVPVVNYAYWSLLWARRRATGQPPSRAAPLALERTPGFTHQRKVLQYSADWRDMELDGKHWRAQFGGSNGRAPRTGAYVFFSATTYAPVRLLLALGAVALFTVRIVDYNRRLDDDGSEHTAADGAKALLYFGTWLQAVACLYFALAAALTSFAVYSPGAEAERAPFLVWVAWMLHGMVLPASLVNALFWPFVAEGYELTARGLGFAYTYVTLAMVLFDLYINRQPYYAAYHGLVGLVFVYVYLLFNAIYVTAGGTDALGHDYIYKAFASPDTETSAQAFFSAGKVAFFELFLVVPFLNVLFWCMLWARRRARVSASAKMGSP